MNNYRKRLEKRDANIAVYYTNASQIIEYQ